MLESASSKKPMLSLLIVNEKFRSVWFPFWNRTQNITLSAYQLDIARVKFLLRSYFRVRLAKIERMVRCILTTPVSGHYFSGTLLLTAC